MGLRRRPPVLDGGQHRERAALDRNGSVRGESFRGRRPRTEILVPSDAGSEFGRRDVGRVVTLERFPLTAYAELIQLRHRRSEGIFMGLSHSRTTVALACAESILSTSVGGLHSSSRPSPRSPRGWWSRRLLWRGCGGLRRRLHRADTNKYGRSA